MADDYPVYGDGDVFNAGIVPRAAELPEIKLFGRWPCDEVQVGDMSLQVNNIFTPMSFFYIMQQNNIECVFFLM